jgi:mannose-6-phosphate isomerase-like protein (cupin superfamily)
MQRQEEHELSPGRGITVEPLMRHKFINASDAPVRFLVISAPKKPGDRVDEE